MVVLAPLTGLLVDRVETRRVLVLGALGQAGAAAALAFTTSVPVILVLTAVLGAGWPSPGRPCSPSCRGWLASAG